MIAELIEKLTSKAEAAETSFDQLAVAVVEGKNVSEAKIEQACQAAGLSLTAFASQLKTLERRKDAWTAANDRDWPAEREAIKDERTEATESVASVKKELDELRAESVRLHETLDRCLRNLSTIQAEEKAVRDECDRVLRATGDADDWRSIGEPVPKPRRHYPGEKIVTDRGTITV